MVEASLLVFLFIKRWNGDDGNVDGGHCTEFRIRKLFTFMTYQHFKCFVNAFDI